jgi:hypothetical protein
MANYSLTRKSSNKKTGPIPVSTTSADTCPAACPFKGAGMLCGRLSRSKWRWDEVTRGERGGTLEAFCADVAALPAGQFWRHNQAGDLPGDGERNRRGRARRRSSLANNGQARVYVHPLQPGPEAPERGRNFASRTRAGFTVNLSANNLEHADELAALDVGPVAVVLPAAFDARKTTTPAGRPVAQCGPARRPPAAQTYRAPRTVARGACCAARPARIPAPGPAPAQRDPKARRVSPCIMCRRMGESGRGLIPGRRTRSQNMSRTVDLTPSWETAVQIYCAVLENPNASPEGREIARAEIVRLAQSVDAMREEPEPAAA